MQFEDFANQNAFDLLEKYHKTHLVFNYDIHVNLFSCLCTFLCFLLSCGLYNLFLRYALCTLIQGTTSVVLVGLIVALKLVGGTLFNHRFLFLGAGGMCIVKLVSR